jgi:hypothetical protein
MTILILIAIDAERRTRDQRLLARPEDCGASRSPRCPLRLRYIRRRSRLATCKPSAGSSLAFTFEQAGAASKVVPPVRNDRARLRRQESRRGSLEVIGPDRLGRYRRQGSQRHARSGPDLLDAQEIPTAQFSFALGFDEARPTAISRPLASSPCAGSPAICACRIRIVTHPRGLELSGDDVDQAPRLRSGQGEWQATDSVGDEVKRQYKVALSVEEGEVARMAMANFHAAHLGRRLADRRAAVVPPGVGRRVSWWLPGIAFALFAVFLLRAPGCSPGSCASAAMRCRSPTKRCCAGSRAATASTCAGPILREGLDT